ncbi:MAG: nitroreductase family protein [Flavobacteriales bacterium]|nr:nitroreductase family protein [Flavobacteriales bacterium]
MKILDLINNRFSPTDFSNKQITEEEIKLLFEAAGKAASAFNEQPWRFVYALQQDKEEFKLLHECLVEGNRTWTGNVSALVITFISLTYARNGKENAVAKHDLGLAVGNLTMQASSMGLHVHQMAGILPEKIKEVLNVPDGFQPLTAIAIGYNNGEIKFKPRKSVEEIAFKGKWK